MSDSDALLWNIEKDPGLRSTITAIAILDRAPDRARLEDKVERGTRLIPRLRQRVVSAPLSPAPPVWVADPNFDVNYHVRYLRAGGDGSLRDLLDLAQPLAMQGFDRARPLWEFTVVEGLADGRAALIQKIHHSLTDGVGGVQLAMMLLDLERDPTADPGPLPPLPDQQRPAPAELVRDAFTHEARRQLGLARRAARSLAGATGDPIGAARRAVDATGSMARLLAPVFEPLSPVMGGRSLSVHFDTLSVPLDEMKAAAHSVGGKLNDAFVTAVTGGLRRYHEELGAPVEELRMTMPINVRTGDTAAVAGNQFVPARFTVPVYLSDPAVRMAAIRDLVSAERREPSLGFVEPLAGVLNRLPTTLTTQVFGSMLKGVDFVTSNVPGIPVPVYLAGARLEAEFPFAPLSGSGLNVTLMSYLGELHIGVNSDPAAVTDAALLQSCLQEGFDEVRKIA